MSESSVLGDSNFAEDYSDSTEPERNIFDTRDLGGNETENDLSSDSESNSEGASMEDSDSDEGMLDDDAGEMLVDDEDEQSHSQKFKNESSTCIS